MSTRSSSDALRRDAHVLRAGRHAAPAVALAGNALLVLLGEATHGTQEFYATRAEITKHLIVEKGFDAIAVEADWPDALRVSRYILGSGEESAAEALQDFQRFPQWMWRNAEVVALAHWLRMHNSQRRESETRVGFFGLDLYSLRSSMEAVVQYLSQVDPEAARQARERYACFDHMTVDPQHYGRAAVTGTARSCEEEVVRQLLVLRNDAARLASPDAPNARDELFYAEQNARVAVSAEAYYRTMFLGRTSSWNLRDEHMADTLDALCSHIARRKNAPAKIIVWAHNSHIGDARATEMGDHGQVTLGQLARERRAPGETFLLGFTTHTGTVTAASEWDGRAERKTVLPSRPDSVEHLFHDAGLGDFLLSLRNGGDAARLLDERRLERAIGVIYRPESERASHYFSASIARQFDAVMHIDDTHALHALDTGTELHPEDVPETWPSGI